MRKTLLTAAAATMLWTQANAAVSVKVGYSNVAGEFRYNQQVDIPLAPFAAFASQKEDISAGVVTFGGEATASVSKMFSIGFEVGASMTSDFEFDLTNAHKPLDAFTPNMNDGDSVKYSFAKIPVLAKAAVNFEVGPGEATLGLGLGAVIIAWTKEQTDQQWWDGTSVGGPNSYTQPSSSHNNLTDKQHSKQVDTLTVASPLFVFEIAPAYHYKLSDKSSIGFEIPLSFVTETIIDGGHHDVSAAAPTGAVAYPSPYYGQSGPEVMIGGLQWGVNVVYTVRI